MTIKIKATNITLTEPLKTYIEEKIGGLERFLSRFDNPSIIADIDVGRSTNHHRQGEVFYADATIEIPGTVIRGREESEDVRAAIDALKDVLQGSVKRYLGQLDDRDR